MKLTEFIEWVGENSERVVEDSGGLLRTDYPGVLAFDALRYRGRLTGETERVAWSVRIPRHSDNAAEFFEPGFFADIIGIEKIYVHENREFARFLWRAAEKQNTRMIALAFQEITSEKITESILFNIRVQIFEAAQRACFKNRELIPAAQKMLYTLGIAYEPQFGV